MCGILGIVAEAGGSIGFKRGQLPAMRDAMLMRGPDAAGIFERRNVAFAHRRLSIRDIAGGTQPWISDSGECVLVYNGEIYNDASLRRRLGGMGYCFRTHSDTEVVMAAYLQWGKRCVDHLRGMFAFGIYDFRDESLLLVRDRFGIKPLFLTEVDSTLVFASSIPAILAHPKFNRRPHLPAISHYLTTFRLTLGRETLFAGIWQLQPGELLCSKNGNVRIERYWDYPTEEETSLDYPEAVDQLSSGLTDSVECRLISDVPVGMFLSGGVDSNTIACLVRETGKGSMSGQCGGGEMNGSGDSDNESCDFEYARRCAAHVGFDYGEVRLGPDEYLECWQTMLDAYGTPLSTPTDVILYRLSRQMKQSVGVVLGGEGADELLCGYAVQHWAGRDYDGARQLTDGTWSGSGASARLFRGSLLNQYGRDRFTSPTDHYFALNSLIPSSAKQALFNPWAYKQAEADGCISDFYSTLFNQQPEFSESCTSRKFLRVLHRVNLEGLLSRLDAATMLAGLEARVPYADHLLVEAMFRVPHRYKIDVAHDEQAPYLSSGLLEQRGSLRSKRLLRTVAARLMPSSLAYRKKASFPTPVSHWLSGPWSGWVRSRLQESPFGKDVFQQPALAELADNLPQAGMWLWPLINVLEWGDRQFAA